MSSSEKRGTILITTLWILSILSLISIGVAGRMGLELKLTGFYRDDMRALYLAKAAIERVIYEKYKKDESADVDILNESWANDKDLFYDQNISGAEKSSYTVKYVYKESSSGEGAELYGMMDEASRIDINKIIENGDPVAERVQHLVNLLENVCKLDEEDAKDRVNNLIDWMDTNATREAYPNEQENVIYDENGEVKYCKNWKLDSIDELLLVKGFDPVILYGGKSGDDKIYGIVDYITINTGGGQAGKVNVNTAPEEVLIALGFPDRLAKAVIDYRRNEAKTGEPDNKPVTEITSAFFEGLLDQLGQNADESEKADIAAALPYLTLSSCTFRINVYAKVNNVEKRITCAAILQTNGRPVVTYWDEE